MKRARGYSASLDIGHYPVADEGNSMYNSFLYLFSCCCRTYFKESNGYDSDSSDFNRCVDSDTDDD